MPQHMTPEKQTLMHVRAQIDALPPCHRDQVHTVARHLRELVVACNDSGILALALVAAEYAADEVQP